MSDDSPALDDISAAIVALQEAQANDTPLDMGVEGGAQGEGTATNTTIEEFQTPYVPDTGASGGEGAAAGGEGEGSGQGAAGGGEQQGQPGAAAAKTDEEEEQPEPVVHPNSQKPALPEGVAARYRVRASDAEDALALALMTRNPNMKMSAALEEAQRQLGTGKGTSPATDEGQQEHQQTQKPDPAKDLEDQIAALQAEREDLNPGIDHVEFKRITREIEALIGRRSEAAAEILVQKAFQEREALAAADQEADRVWAEAQERFPDLQKEDSEMTLRFAELHNENIRTNSALLSSKTYEKDLAALVAGQLLAEGKDVAVKKPGSTAAPASGNGSASTGKTSGGQPNGSKQTPPGTAAPAGGVSLIPGAATTPTVEHRVTVRQSSSPEQEFGQQLHTAAASDDLLGAAQLLGMSNGGVAPKRLISSVETAAG